MFRTRIQFYLLLVILSLAHTAYSQQKNDPREWFIEAESYFLFEEYKDALPLYQRILRVEPDNYNVKYKIGICYLNDIFLYPKSIVYLEEAVTSINQNYRLNNYREKQAPPEAIYYLGRAYHANNRFNEAIENYQRFLKNADPHEFDLDVVRADIEACQLAKQVYQDPVYFSCKNMGNLINSRFEDINPVISGDGKVLAFTRRMQFYDGVFISYKNENGIWSAPENLTAEFGLDGNSYTTGISYFGDEIFVYRSDDYDGNIYSSKRINNNWTRLEKLNDNINTKYWESHASPSPDGQFLIFTSNREGGYGGLDIYKSRRGTNGVWGPAVNMGPVINSPSNEDTPFLSNEGHTLFFSSQGHNTVGGYDVFVSNLRSDGTWTRPVNMGYPVNSTLDNLFYTPLGINSFGLYSIYKEDDTEGLLDIYEVEVYNSMIPRTFSISGKVVPDDRSTRTDEKIYARLYNTTNRELVSEQRIPDDGTFALKAQQGKYLLVVEGSGIETYQEEISLALTRPSQLMEIPPIGLVTSEKPVKPFIEELPPAIEGVKVKTDFFAVTDSTQVPIELNLIRGSELAVVINVEDELVHEESISDVKKRFTYFYKPKPGENKLKFTATDPDGNKSETEVTIQYYAPPQESGTAAEITRAESGEPMKEDFFRLVAVESLAAYIDQIDIEQYPSHAALYEHLLEKEPEYGYSREELDEMFAIYFAQQDVNAFNRSFVEIAPQFNEIVTGAPDTLDTPLQYISYYEEKQLIPIEEIRATLLAMVSKDGKSPDDVLTILLSYIDGKGSTGDKEDLTDPGQVFEFVSREYGEKIAVKSLELAATSDDPEFFVQNLIASSKDELRTFVSRINLEEEGLYNSVDIIKFLINNVSQDTYSAEELFKSLDDARRNRDYNLIKFHELLTREAEGVLKSELVLISENVKDQDDYRSILNYLLNNSEHKNYTRESVYDLLLKLIGIEDVDEFAEKLISYGYTRINNAIADTSLNYFSSPLELIQYLISATQSYDFTSSDINNLLIRMILERGLDERGGRYYQDELKKNFWKSRQFITAVVMVNIVLLVLIILFSVRKRRTRSEN